MQCVCVCVCARARACAEISQLVFILHGLASHNIKHVTYLIGHTLCIFILCIPDTTHRAGLLVDKGTVVKRRWYCR